MNFSTLSTSDMRFVRSMSKGNPGIKTGCAGSHPGGRTHLADANGHPVCGTLTSGPVHGIREGVALINVIDCQKCWDKIGR